MTVVVLQVLLRIEVFGLGLGMAFRSNPGTGAWIAPESHAEAQAKNLNPQEYLQDNNSHGFFKQLDSLVVSGPTLTNVNDFRAILVEDPNQPSRFGV